MRCHGDGLDVVVHKYAVGTPVDIECAGRILRINVCAKNEKGESHVSVEVVDPG